ncbi:MAG: tRNA (guanosine(37)-N1)-methyltransferase TrmD [Vicinamibacterales bacterium]
MKVDVLTIFPAMFEPCLREGILGRAVSRGLLDVAIHDLRDFTSDRHRSVDDVPFGGGPGMVMKVEPIVSAVERIRQERGDPAAIVLTSPRGRRFSHAEAARLAALPHVAILCGRYEGIDERIREHVATEEISIGDYVLTGGELAALVIVDACARLIPGAVGDGRSVEEDSFARGLLDFPQYTRPARFGSWAVPEVLLSGNHAQIRKWRKRQAVEKTVSCRPDLLGDARLDDEELEILRELQAQREEEGLDGRD